jgi:adenylate cyclase class IV
MKKSLNVEIERKFLSTYELFETDVMNTLIYKESICHDRYFTCPNGLIRLRDDKEKGLEITAKTYKKDNLHRTEVNLNLLGNSLDNCLEFARTAGWTMRLEFKQFLKIWITNNACVSQTVVCDLNNKPYRFSRELNFISEHPSFPKARFIEIEALDATDRKQAIRDIKNVQLSLGLSNKDIIKHSLVQLFGAYPC